MTSVFTSIPLAAVLRKDCRGKDGTGGLAGRL